MLSASSFFTLSLLVFGLALAAEPRHAVWSKQAFGPDGPWNAVEVSIGSQRNIALFPGRMFHTYVTTSDYCAFNNSVPHCASGTYLKDDIVSGLSNDDLTRRISYRPETQLLTAGIEARGLANMFLETVSMQFATNIVKVKDHSIALIESKSQMFAYPDGTLYPIFTGCLSIGAPDRQQVFTGMGAVPTVNASMIPWALEAAGETPSSSFGLHYGSAGVTAKMPGSLLFGGYDRNRVIGPILTLDADLRNPATLQDISLHVIKGASPFRRASTTTTNTEPPPSTITGLLTQDDDTTTTTRRATTRRATTLPVILDPCSPYLTLPKPTCDAIASHLPVTYNATLGLYLWDTTSPLYPLLVSSATTLAFTFMSSTRNTESHTIHLPLPHLNLTLSPPFTAAPVPYFPCYTGGAPEGTTYALGRAFFQDAFLGANWERGTAWLAQAPGPNIPAGVDVVGVEAGEAGIEGGGNDWERSWEGAWRVLEEGDVEGLGGGEGGSTTTSTTGGGDGDVVGGGGDGGGDSASGGDGEGEEAAGLSTGAMVGIGVGVAIVGTVLVGVAGMMLWRRRKLGQAMAPRTMPPESVASPTVYGEQQYGAKWPDAVWIEPSEAPATHNAIYEMPGDGPGRHTSTGLGLR